MMCNKDILQLSFEDLNKFTSPLKISYHYISSVTVSSSNTHPICASCMLTRHVLLGHLDPEGGTDWLFQNVGMELPFYVAHNSRR